MKKAILALAAFGPVIDHFGVAPAFGQRSLPASATPSANERIGDDTLSVEENMKKNKRNDKKMIEGVKVLDKASESQQPALRTL